MSHARQTIRDAFVAAVTGLSITGSRVYKARIMPLDDDCLPGLLVKPPFESITENDEVMGTVQERALQIDVSGYDKLTAGLDDQLDDIAAEIETAVFAATLPNVYGLDLIETETDIVDGAEQPVGEITLSFRVQYLTEAGSPGTAL